MRQLVLATAGLDKHAKQTRRAALLAEVDNAVPWSELCAVVGPGSRANTIAPLWWRQEDGSAFRPRSTGPCRISWRYTRVEDARRNPPDRDSR
jgi:hypothetical protein